MFVGPLQRTDWRWNWERNFNPAKWATSVVVSTCTLRDEWLWNICARRDCSQKWQDWSENDETKEGTMACVMFCAFSVTNYCCLLLTHTVYVCSSVGVATAVFSMKHLNEVSFMIMWLIVLNNVFFFEWAYGKLWLSLSPSGKTQANIFLSVCI